MILSQLHGALNPYMMGEEMWRATPRRRLRATARTQVVALAYAEAYRLLEEALATAWGYVEEAPDDYRAALAEWRPVGEDRYGPTSKRLQGQVYALQARANVVYRERRRQGGLRSSRRLLQPPLEPDGPYLLELYYRALVNTVTDTAPAARDKFYGQGTDPLLAAIEALSGRGLLDPPVVVQERFVRLMEPPLRDYRATTPPLRREPRWPPRMKKPTP